MEKEEVLEEKELSSHTKRKCYMLTTLKYFFSVVLTFAAVYKIGRTDYLMAGILELFCIFVLSNLLLHIKVIGQIVNTLLLLLYNVQMAVLMFANSYITMVMLTNLDSVKALSGKAGIYIPAVLIVIVFSVMPIQKIEFDKVSNILLVISSAGLWIGFLLIFGEAFSPLYGYCDLGIQQYQSIQLQKMIRESVANAEDEEILTEFYNMEIEDYRQKDAGLAEQPNVILIFTEGLSQNVISDEREIMPNYKKWQSKSLNFENYYNHTFATYRGLSSQLYSGYQLEDYDVNTLPSLQSILSNEGYDTIFINSEPNNEEFSAYLSNFGFDELLGDKNSVCNGEADTISDKDVYEMLFDTAEEHQATGKPFFMATYTFGTHASLDSTDQVFGDGTNDELNKFFDVDYQFGQFMEKFENSTLADNTIIIMTADHATYQDDSFSEAFPEYEREATPMDRIPLFIYHKGIEAENIDVNGRNTICLTPTILDYLDISVPNCFVGTSLFSRISGSVCETSFTDAHILYTTKDNQINDMKKEEEKEFMQIVQNYYILKELKLQL